MNMNIVYFLIEIITIDNFVGQIFRNNPVSYLGPSIQDEILETTVQN